MILYQGEDVEEILTRDPMFGTDCVTETLPIDFRVINEKSSEAFVKICYTLHIDPNIVRKQAEEIQRLQRMVDYLACEKFSYIGAPTFREYCHVVKENEELRDQIERIKAVLRGDDDE